MDEASLLAMPDEDYMNDAQRHFFLQYLLRHRADHEERLVESQEGLHGRRCWGDAMDRAVAEANQARLAKRAEHESQQLRRIAAAIERIHTQDFGYCLETGDPIGLKRLLFDPATEYSFDVQARRERTHARGERKPG